MTPTLNAATHMLRADGNPVQEEVMRMLMEYPEEIAAVQPVPTPEELALWASKNCMMPEVAAAITETRERYEAISRAMGNEQRAHTHKILTDTSFPEWQFATKPIIKAWLTEQINPNRTVPERFVITGWISKCDHENNTWTIMAPAGDRMLASVSGVAEGMPQMKRGQLAEFHTSRAAAGDPHQLWHINTLDVKPENAGIHPVKLAKHSAYRGQ